MDCFVPSFESSDCLQSTDCCVESDINSKPVVVLKRLSEEVIQRYDKQFFDKYIDKEVPNNEDITQTDLMRCLGLISTNHLESKPIQWLKQSFPLRSIARIGDQLTDGLHPILLDKTLIVRQNFKKVVRRVRKKSQKSEIKSNVVSKEEIERQKGLQQIKEMNKQLREETNQKKKIISFVTQFEITSELFERLVRTFDCLSLSATEVNKLSLKSIVIPVYDTNKKLLKSESDVKYNSWSASNVERRALKSELAFSLKGKTHKFTFSRRQRLEKNKRLKCGLNWKSRLLLSNCKQLVVDLLLINKCSLCLESLVDNHSCNVLIAVEEQPLIASHMSGVNDNLISTNGCTSLDLNDLIIESIVSDIEDKDLENDSKKSNQKIENKDKEDVKKSMDNMKRVFVEIDFNFEVNSMPEMQTRSKRLKSTKK